MHPISIHGPARERPNKGESQIQPSPALEARGNLALPSPRSPLEEGQGHCYCSSHQRRPPDPPEYGSEGGFVRVGDAAGVHGQRRPRRHRRRQGRGEGLRRPYRGVPPLRQRLLRGADARARPGNRAKGNPRLPLRPQQGGLLPASLPAACFSNNEFKISSRSWGGDFPALLLHLKMFSAASLLEWNKLLILKRLVPLWHYIAVIQDP